MKRAWCIAAALLSAMTFGLAGCGEDPLAKGKTKVIFWGYADDAEAQLMEDIVSYYNQNNTDNIYIDYLPQVGGSYVTLAERALASSKGPDVFYLGDRYLKRWTKRGYLENLQPFVDAAGLDFGDTWTSSEYRWRYDPVLNTNNMDDPVYALPRDITSTALYYNASEIEAQGIAIISVDEEDLDAFNAGGKDRNGKTKEELGLGDFTVPAKGFYRDQYYRNGRFTVPAYGDDGKVIETMVFNNRIAMSWDEVEDLAMILTKEYNPHLGAKDTTWGYYTEWWFNYGWSVGGDCARDTTGEGDWVFTLGDKTQKRIVYNADGTPATDEYGKEVFVAEGESYSLGEGQTLGELLPSQYDAFERFIKLGKPKEYGGLAIAPRVGADIGLSTSTAFFSSGKVAMLVETSDKITTMRKGITSFAWDVAPMPVYKTYNADGSVKAKGIEVCHSGSTGLGVWSNSKVKDAAFKVAVYLSTGEAQKMLAHNGAYLPNSVSSATTDFVDYNVGLGASPKNIQIFTRMARNSRPGDWWYMPDNLWIDNWATPLNTTYRENDASIDDFFERFTDSTNEILANYKKAGMIG